MIKLTQYFNKIKKYIVSERKKNNNNFVIIGCNHKYRACI